MPSIHLRALPRVLLAWLLISILVGASVFWLEIEREDERIAAVALNEARHFPAELLRQAAQGETSQLQPQLAALLKRHFKVVELYDAQRSKLAEVVAPDAEALEDSLRGFGHGFPTGEALTYQRLRIDGRWVLQVLVPLKLDGQLAGFLEGVFAIDAETEQRIMQDVMFTLGSVLFAVLATVVVLYPLLIALNRHALQLAAQMLRGNLDMMEVLGSAIAKRDSDTNTHNYRVALYAIALGEAAGLDQEGMRALINGAFLHDVGKIGIPDAILLKPGKLDDEEFAIMRTHVELGSDIIRHSAWLQPARAVVEGHHEKFDGSGYPNRLAGHAIPLEARIFAIVDVFDALTSARPYKAPFPIGDALRMLHEQAGRHFDPALLAHFASLAPKLHGRWHQASEAALREALAERVAHYYAV